MAKCKTTFGRRAVHPRPEGRGFSRQLDKPGNVWLMSSRWLEEAIHLRDAYLKRLETRDAEWSLESNHQNSIEWSAAPLVGLEYLELPFSSKQFSETSLDYDEADLTLALMRYTLDPCRKRRNFGG